MNSQEGQLCDVFETLADWEEQLKHLDIDFDALEDNSGKVLRSDMEGPKP
ncbi:MAG: hypothetical protein GKS00_10475 [Alphaproteobacteria bacterium]|nr:hypothetical protein [Alphaproteobacteria bacterium]